MSHPNSEKPTDGTAASSAAALPVTAPALTELELPLGTAVESVAPRAERVDPIQLAYEQADRGEMSAGVATLRALVVREPGHARGRAALAVLLERKGDVEGAISELSRALDTVPDDVGILCARATLLTSRGRYDQAEVDIRRAARVDDRDARLPTGSASLRPGNFSRQV